MKKNSPFSNESFDSLDRYLESDDAQWFRNLMKSLGKNNGK